MTTLSTQLLPSSSSSSNPRWTYDVFPSFRGEDVRNNFRSHLLAALSRTGVIAFTDDEKLKRGEDLDEELSKAIRESQCAVVVFSENYAFSKWCLRELAMIADCRKAETPMMVLPVFYHVEPSHVRNQLGTFADAFAGHIKDPKVDQKEIEIWRVALRQVGRLAGWHVDDGRPEAEIVEEISRRLLLELSRNSSSISEGLVGVKSKVEEVITLLCIEGDDDVRYVGICGMGGIGKTTIAQEVYNQISCEYEARCLVVCASEEARKPSLVDLQKQFLSQLLRDDGINVWNHLEGIKLIAKRLANKKVFIVLDNVDPETQIKELVGKGKLFGPGSKILITSRDSQLLAPYVDEVYHVEELNNNEALELFSWKAFKKSFPDEEFVEISRDIVDCAKGLPLAIEVFGSSLYDEKSIDFWKSARDQFKQHLHSDIVLKLKPSFYRLEDIQKQLFLDVACFFNGQWLDNILPILESFGYFPNCNLGVLEARSLIKISEFGALNMHDVLVQVGRQIVDQESPNEPGGRSRLWRQEDIIYTLKNNDDVIAVEGICLNLSRKLPHEVQDQVSLEAFSKMKKMRILKIAPNDGYYFFNKPYSLKWFGDPSKFMLTNKLCYMNWFQYPLKSLPTTFQPNNLVKLILHNSHLEKLWDGRMRLQKLLLIDLSDSKNLIETPDFTAVPNLVELLLSRCKMLTKVHQSIGSLKQLKNLDLNSCENFQSLPDMSNMLSLKELSLSSCKRLTKVHQSVGSLKQLELLDLNFCENLQSLPDMSNMLSLKELWLLSCKRLTKVHQSVGSLKQLELLDLNFCENLQSLPDMSNMLSLKELWLSSCKRLTKVHQSVGSLKQLELLCLNSCENLQSLPDMSNMLSLRKLNLSTNKIETLPSSIMSLSSLETLDLERCNESKKIPQNSGSMESLEFLDLKATGLRELPCSVFMNKLKALFINEEVSNPVTLLLPKSFLGLSSLTSLSLRYCNLLDETIPTDLWSLPLLAELNLAGNKLTKIPQLTELRRLELKDNSSLRMLPKLSRHLQYLDLRNCPLLDTFYMDMWTSNEILWTSGSIIEEIYFGYDGESYNNLQLHPKSSYWIGHPYTEPQRVAWGPTRGYEIPRWFNQRSNSSSVKVQICKDVRQKLEGIALFIVYEVREADSFERKQKVRKLDRHENSNYREFCQRNPTFPEIVCQLQFNGDHPPPREVFVLRAPYVTPDGLHGVWVVIPITKYSELRWPLDRGSGVEASIAISSRNVEVKECGVSLVQDQEVTECCEVLSGVSGFGSIIPENPFSCLRELLLRGPIKEGYRKEFPKRRLVKAAARIINNHFYPWWELPLGRGIGKGSLEEFLECGIVEAPEEWHFQQADLRGQAILSSAPSQASLPRKRKFMQQE